MATWLYVIIHTHKPTWLFPSVVRIVGRSRGSHGGVQGRRDMFRKGIAGGLHATSRRRTVEALEVAQRLLERAGV